MSMKAKRWINKNDQALMRELDRLFRRYYNEAYIKMLET